MSVFGLVLGRTCGDALPLRPAQLICAANPAPTVLPAEQIGLGLAVTVIIGVSAGFYAHGNDADAFAVIFAPAGDAMARCMY